MVRALGPGEDVDHLFRARIFQSGEKLKRALVHPVEELGPPPMTLARAGRMNAAGVAVFYGALDPRTAIGEIRPPTRSRVVVARFDLLRPLRLLDVDRLRTIFVEGSVFDRAYAERLRHAKFLESVSARIVRPVMPDDEPFDYLPTQAIADFLASAEGLDLDGMIYASAQVGDCGRNVVLFHKAACVTPLSVPEGAAICAELGDWDGDEWQYDYRVRVELPPGAAASSERPLSHFAPPKPDKREPALRLDTATMHVHEVLPQEVKTDAATVAWTVTGPRQS